MYWMFTHKVSNRFSNSISPPERESSEHSRGAPTRAKCAKMAGRQTHRCGWRAWCRAASPLRRLDFIKLESSKPCMLEHRSDNPPRRARKTRATAVADASCPHPLSSSAVPPTFLSDHALHSSISHPHTPFHPCQRCTHRPPNSARLAPQCRRRTTSCPLRNSEPRPHGDIWIRFRRARGGRTRSRMGRHGCRSDANVRRLRRLGARHPTAAEASCV